MSRGTADKKRFTDLLYSAKATLELLRKTESGGLILHDHLRAGMRILEMSVDRVEAQTYKPATAGSWTLS